jgi:uncharacterized membrane protein
MELLEWQFVIVGFVAVVLAEGIKFYRNKSGKDISITAIQWVTFAISFPLALWWGGVNLPALPVVVGDPALIVGNILAYVSAWVVLAGAFIGNATVIYHLLKKLVFEKLG